MKLHFRLTAFGVLAGVVAAASSGTAGRTESDLTELPGLPPASERSPLPHRQQRFSSSHAKMTILVYPVRIRGVADSECAAHIARLLSQAAIGQACLVAAPLTLTTSSGPNELAALWNLARDFRAHLRRNPPAADYVLFADYGINPARWEPGFVHLVLCDANGDWVIVDLQNARQADFRNLKPVTKADCDRLVVRRLQHYVRRALNLGVDDTTGE